MNKKLVALLIPMMLLPLMGFAYAHWTDSARKNYYLHAGTVKTEIIWWHIEGTNTYDVNCNDVIYGDEINITEVEEWDDELEEWETKKLDITVDPIYPSWFLDLEVIIHNKGRLSIKADEPIGVWTLDDEVLIDPATGDPYNATNPPPYWQYIWAYYIWDADFEEWIKVEPTTMIIKPSEVLRVKQYIHFIGQDYPELQCHWLDLHVEIPFFQFIGEEWSSLPAGPYVP